MPTSFLIALCALALACGVHDPSELNQPPHESFVSISLTAAMAEEWQHRHEISADLDGDGRPETVALVSDVELNSTGEPLWEDGHRWALLISDDSQTTLAYAAFVPNGFVEAALLQLSSDRTREVLLLERTPDQLRALTLASGVDSRVSPGSAGYYQIDSWLPGFATLQP